MTNSMKRERQPWIDFCRGLAMLAVIVDHTSGFYPAFFVQHSIFSVTMFIILGGYCSSLSLKMRTGPVFPYVYKRLAAILLPYALATAVYSFRLDNNLFYIPYYLVRLVLFNSSAPLYFLVFYVQLIAVSPLLYQCTSRLNNIFTSAAFLIMSIFLSYLFMNYTSLAGFYGGANFLMGGSYFVAFVLGMIFFNYSEALAARRKYLICTLAVSILAELAFEYYGLLLQQPPNPPGWVGIVFTLLVFLAFFSIFNLAKGYRIPVFGQLSLSIQAVGRRSLIIYLYHPLIIELARPYMLTGPLTALPEVLRGLILILSTVMIPLGYYRIVALFKNRLISPKTFGSQG